MMLTKFRSLFMSLFGMRYRELPPGICRSDIDLALSELGAEKCGEYGTPAFEVNNEYFPVGRRKIRVCTEDELFISLWGSKASVDEVYARIIESCAAKKKS